MVLACTLSEFTSSADRLEMGIGHSKTFELKKDALNLFSY
jgi:hypothetical protein